MSTVLAFAVVLLVAVLLSDLAHRTILSIAVVFLAAGFVLGDGVTGVIDLRARTDVVANFAELALFSVLFTDGMRVGIGELRAAWRLPGKALGAGLPLTLLLTAVLAHLVAGVPWGESLLLGAALSPTDPVFASAIVARPEIPARVRHLLNVESGLNDGLALPIVVVLLEVVASDPVRPLTILAQAAAGTALGVAVPWIAVKIPRTRVLGATADYAPLYAFAIGLLVYAVAHLTQVNAFLAAFAAGMTIASVSDHVRSAFHRFGDIVAELLKLAALLVFGALVSPALLGAIGVGGWAFALVAVVVARPVALTAVLSRSPLSTLERRTAAWFGPKGFASVVYGLLILDTRFADSAHLFHLVAATVVISIVLHSSTDVVIANRFASDARRDDVSA